jgi:uncharacterized membrane protein YdjX (TVP38/TMEM64 family)
VTVPPPEPEPQLLAEVPPPEPEPQLLAEVPRRYFQLAVVVILVLVVLGGSVARDALGIEFSAESVRLTVDSMGPIAPIAFVFALTFRFFLMIPSPILLMGGGLCFGAALGALYGGLGLTLAALWKWMIVHWAGAEAVQSWVPPRLQVFLRLTRSRFGALALTLASGYPIGPISGVHLAAAVAGMTFASFVLAVGMGSLLRAFLFSFFGSALFSGGNVLLGAALLLGAAGIPLLIPSWRRWLFARPGKDPREAAASDSE